MHAMFSTVHGHTARIAHEITSFSRSLTFMIIDQKCITLARNSKLARVTVSLCMYIQLERAPMIHWPVFQPTFIHFPISRLAKTRPCLLRTKLGANFSTSSQQEDAASRTTSLDLSTPRNLQFEILNEPPPLDPPSNGRNPTRKGRKLERAMGARVIVDSNLCEFLFFFFSFLIYGQIPVCTLKRRQPRCLDSGSRTCAHAQFMQVWYQRLESSPNWL